MQAPLYFPKKPPQLNPAVFYVFFQVVTTLFYFFVLPALLTKFILKTPLKKVGYIIPKNQLKTYIAFIIAFLLLVPSMYALTQYPSFRAVYTLKDSPLIQLSVFALLFPIYYFAEEFFFRGFLFLSLWERLGWHSFWITDIIFTLSHFGKPMMEILLCIPASVIFNFLTLYTRSFFPAMVIHYIMGIFALVWVNFC